MQVINKYTFCNLISYSLFCIDLSKLYLYYDHTGNSSVVGLRVIQFTHGPNACIHLPFLCWIQSQYSVIGKIL